MFYYALYAANHTSIDMVPVLGLHRPSMKRRLSIDCEYRLDATMLYLSIPRRLDHWRRRIRSHEGKRRGTRFTTTGSMQQFKLWARLRKYEETGSAVLSALVTCIAVNVV